MACKCLITMHRPLPPESGRMTPGPSYSALVCKLGRVPDEWIAKCKEITHVDQCWGWVAQQMNVPDIEFANC